MAFVEKNSLDTIISWVMNGQAFMIHDPDKLVPLLPLFFSLTKYRSFRRQLNMWHFDRVENGKFKGAFMHPYFVQGKKDLCNKMSRQWSMQPKVLQERKSQEPTSFGVLQRMQILSSMGSQQKQVGVVGAAVALPASLAANKAAAMADTANTQHPSLLQSLETGLDHHASLLDQTPAITSRGPAKTGLLSWSDVMTCYSSAEPDKTPSEYSPNRKRGIVSMPNLAEIEHKPSVIINSSSTGSLPYHQPNLVGGLAHSLPNILEHCASLDQHYGFSSLQPNFLHDLQPTPLRASNTPTLDEGKTRQEGRSFFKFSQDSKRSVISVSQGTIDGDDPFSMDDDLFEPIPLQNEEETKSATADSELVGSSSLFDAPTSPSPFLIHDEDDNDFLASMARGRSNSLLAPSPGPVEMKAEYYFP